MAPNSHPDPKPSSEEEASAEESSSSEDVEQYKISPSLPKKPSAQTQPNTSITPTSRPQPSSSSDSEPDSQPLPDQKSKPTSPKPVSAKRKKAIGEHDEIAILEQPRPDRQSKPISPKPTVEESPPKRKAVKRKASGVVEETPKKKPRLFSEDDEIAILHGMNKYKKKTRVEPSSDWNAFLEFVRDSLQLAEAKKTQLSEKVRGLRQKYEKSMARVKKNGGVHPEFWKAHDKRVFKLSKRIWGNGGDSGLGNEKAKVDNNSKRGSSRTGGEKSEGERVGEFWSGGFFGSFGGLCMGKQAVKDGWELISESDNEVELEGRRNELMMEELELYSKKLDLISKQGKMVLEAMSS